jgi:hypothetical protein
MNLKPRSGYSNFASVGSHTAAPLIVSTAGVALVGLAAIFTNLSVLGHTFFSNEATRQWYPFAFGMALAAIVALSGMVVFSQRITHIQQPRPASEQPEATPEPQKLPDPLHSANSLDNKPWVNLVEECVALVDEVDRLRLSLDPMASDFADHVSCRVLEILERSGVTIIFGDASFDRNRHEPETPSDSVAEGTPILEFLSPGFSVERRIFRRARVKVTDSASAEKGTPS